jgi:hypothetical protein
LQVINPIIYKIMWQSIQGAPVAPQNPPSNPDATDLATISGLILDWGNNAAAWQAILTSLTSDPNYLQWQNFMTLSDPLGVDKYGNHGFEYGTNQASYSSASNTNWNQGITFITNQKNLIAQADAAITAANNNEATLQQQYNQFANTGAGGQEEKTLTQDAVTHTVQAQAALTTAQGQAAQQTAQAAATADAAKTKQYITITVVATAIIIIIYVIYRYYKKKDKPA